MTPLKSSSSSICFCESTMYALTTLAFVSTVILSDYTCERRTPALRTGGLTFLTCHFIAPATLQPLIGSSKSASSLSSSASSLRWPATPYQARLLLPSTIFVFRPEIAAPRATRLQAASGRTISTSLFGCCWQNSLSVASIY